jgi:hypothetical protein
VSLTHNERTELTASYLNTMAGTVFAAGVVAPLAAVTFGYTGPAAPVSTLTFAIGVSIFFLVSIGLHAAGRYILKGRRARDGVGRRDLGASLRRLKQARGAVRRIATSPVAAQRNRDRSWPLAQAVFVNGSLMPHVVLLGDSIFDNKAYVGGGPDVIAQVREDLPEGWTATLVAVDGATTASIRGQLSRVPEDATHLVISIGGNDALGHSGVLSRPARSVAEVLDALREVSRAFERDYRTAIDLVLARGLPTALCTIYNPAYPDPIRQRVSVAALTFMNDPIVRVAAEKALPLIDLRLICTEPADYANPIEPSSRGGEKIAAVITGLVLNHDFASRRALLVR